MGASTTLHPVIGSESFQRLRFRLHGVAGYACHGIATFVVGFRNPLHAVAGCARFILEQCSPDDDIYDDVCVILSGTTQMSNLITSIVEWTNVNSEKAELCSEALDVMPFLSDAVRRKDGLRILGPRIFKFCIPGYRWPPFNTAVNLLLRSFLTLKMLRLFSCT